jgi:hypothetical protein
MLVALAASKQVRLFVESCAGDRNILSHGSTGMPVVK